MQHSAHKSISEINSEFVDRMMADIEKREIHLKELQDAERAYFDMHQKSIDNFEKDRYYISAFNNAPSSFKRIL